MKRHFKTRLATIFYLLARVLEDSATVTKAIAEFSYRRGRHLQTKRTVYKPPGSLIASIAEFFLSKKTYTSVIRPALDDMRHEYYEAIASGRSWKARWCKVRGNYSIAAAFVVQVPLSLSRMAVKVWKSSSH